jgi:hypothetical protein
MHFVLFHLLSKDLEEHFHNDILQFCKGVLAGLVVNEQLNDSIECVCRFTYHALHPTLVSIGFGHLTVFLDVVQHKILHRSSYAHCLGQDKGSEGEDEIFETVHHLIHLVYAHYAEKHWQ